MGGIAYNNATDTLDIDCNNAVAVFDSSKDATFQSAVGVGVTGGSNAKLEVATSSGEVFRADSSGGAFRIVANQTR